MKRTTTLGLALIGVLFFTSCKREESINIDQNRIYSNYDYTYDANANKSLMTATFRLDNSGGKKIQLSYPARVDFEGEGLAWRQALGYYQLSNSNQTLSGSFNYHDLDDQTFSNSVSGLESIEIPFGITSISQNGNFFLPWTGTEVRSGETVRVTIKGGEQPSSKSWTITSAGSTHIILDENRLRGLTPGTAQIFIEREVSKGLTHSNLSGGRITSKYLSRKININITD